MIRGYPHRASVAPGETLVLHVSTDAARFRINVYRWHDGPMPVFRSRPLPGRDAPPAGADVDWGWPEYALRVPEDWPSAVYIVHFETDSAEDSAATAAHRGPPDLALDRAAALFVVRGHDTPARGARRRARPGAAPDRRGILYKVPLNTYHAYNMTGGGCFYVNPPRSADPPGARVSLRRPGGGIGGEVWGAADDYDQSSPRQTFAHWDAPFIRWLARHGYAAEFCTDADLHDIPDLCARYRLLLSVGHDEYWSEPARDQVEDFVAAGGHAAFFGANVCWWRVRVVDGGAALVCHQGGPRGARDHWWPPTGANRPEDVLTGVSYRHGGGWWDGPRRTGGFVVQKDGHWVFAGTGLRAADRFGAGGSPPLVGYECDGAPIAAVDDAGLAVLAPSHATTGTPAEFEALAVAVLDGDWQELPPREGYAAGQGIHTATMGLLTRGGTVFTAGTTDWAQVLARGDAVVDRLTRNVIDRLAAADATRQTAAVEHATPG